MPKKKRQDYVIIGYHPDDEYELPVNLYLSVNEMADDLQLTTNRVNNIIQTGFTYKKTKCKYLKVRF